jgi:predicted transcriptional regulator
MNAFKLFDAEFRFVSIIWESEPLNSTELTKLAFRELGWKKSTTYTMIKKLCERGILKNEDATVTSLITKAQVQKHESDELLEKAFDNSLPTFLASFLRDRKLTREEAAELQHMIEEAAK